MSAIFGIFNRNGKPIDREIVNTMLDATSTWGPDDHGITINGPVALGHTMLWNTPESKLEHLPNKQEHLTITMDARLDNRDELAEKLTMKHRPLQQITDSDFILAAYRKWGDECPKYLLGDFVFAIWDIKKQTLFCSRDHVGIKPFYFALTAEYFVFANDIEPVLLLPNISNEINDEAVANYFTYRQLKHPTITFYKNINKLKPATTLKLDNNFHTFNTYWRPEKAAKIKLDCEEDYVSLLQNLMKSSVETRTRSISSVGSHLSGGLDSSAISVIASRKLQEQGRILHAFNWLHTPTNHENEKDIDFSVSKEIARREMIQHKYINFDKHDLFYKYLNHDITFNDTVWFWYEHFLRTEARKDNIRTLISGWGGDEFISNHGFAHLAGLFWKGHVWKSISEIYQITKNSRPRHFIYSYLSKFFHYIVLPLLPHSLYCKANRMDCDQGDYDGALNKKFKLYKDTLGIRDDSIATIGGRAQQLDFFNHGHIQTRLESWAAGGMRDAIEYRYPLLDKRLIEFSLGIPEKYALHNGHTRYLFRKSITGLLPSEICWRANTKYEPNRLKKLQEISLSAVQLWLRHTLKNKNNTNIYLDYNALHALFFRLPGSNAESFDVTLDTIKLSILASKIGTTHEKNRQ